MLIIFISYEFLNDNKQYSKMQEIASYNVAATDTQKWHDTVTCWLFEYRSYSFKLLTVSLHFTATFNTQPAWKISSY